MGGVRAALPGVWRMALMLGAWVLTTAWASPALAQTPPARLTFSQNAPIEPLPGLPDLPAPPPATAPTSDAPAAPARPRTDLEVLQASCVNCNSGGSLSPYGNGGNSGGCSSCGAGAAGCYPGRDNCPPCERCNHCDNFFCRFYDCICCPDPCYEPKWTPIADAAFYVDAARPQTQTRFRFDPGVGMILPDRAEYFWARADGNGSGPKPPNGARGELRLGYMDTSLYTEAATGRVGAFFEMSYRSLDPDYAPHAAGFGDMQVGAKTLLLDCELLQLSMQFRTYLPVGSAGKGLGTGHVSLEPSLLLGLRVSDDSHIQAQISEWIPIGGDPNYSGAIFHYHFSWNNVLYRFHPQVPLISTLEFNGWSFQDGSYTDPGIGAFQKAGDSSYFSAGPGLRLFVCDKLDFGTGISFALTDQHWATTLYRCELRLRF